MTSDHPTTGASVGAGLAPAPVDETPVDITEIMRQVRRKISERQGRQSDDELSQNLHLANEQWDKSYAPLHLSPSRSGLGKAWDVVRLRLHHEVRGYLDPMIFRQSEFNGTLVRVLNILSRRFNNGATVAEIESLRDEVIQLREQVRRLEERLPR
ncbi:MAG: hypothetical protein H0X37_03920 [Herpetosiphonaceae bacterium]|nr:hypothetical protein [Herpetosiphonaceae bacterium]